MATIAENNAVMTIFYFKSTGNIYSATTGIIDNAGMFGDNMADLSTVVDSMQFPIDLYVIQNIRLFKLDITETPVILALIPVVQVNTYPIATS